MRKVCRRSTVIAVIPLSIGLYGCGSTSTRDISSAKAVSYYEVYDSRGALKESGYGSHPYGNKLARATGGAAVAGDWTDRTRRASGGAEKAGPVVQTVTTRAVAPRRAPTSLLSEVGVRKDFLPTSARGRSTSRALSARYITIHSTQNWSQGADAWRHSLALKRSKLGRLSWHYTVDQNVAVQHLPTTITGNHADFDGPGNRYSIGIEMCEHPGNSRSKTVERTAKLAAYLMYKHDIPLSKVVPHYHWPRHGMNPAHKNCPHFLLDNGRPGPKWRAFQAKVKDYYDEITSAGAVYVSR